MPLTKHMETWATYECEEGAFRLELVPDSDDIEVRVVGNRAVVGYLCKDEDCPNPMTDRDGEGMLYTTSYDTITDDKRATYAALGLDNDGEPDIQPFEEQAEEWIVREAIQKLLPPHELLHAWEWAGDEVENGERVSVIFCVTESRETAAREFAVHDTHEWRDGGIYHRIIRGEGCTVDVRYWEDRALEMWHEARKAGKVGEPYAVIIDYRDWGSGGSVYRVEEAANTFDYSRSIDGVWVPDKDLLDDIQSKETEEARWERTLEICAGVLDEYTKWCNGDCWGYVIQEFARRGETAPWIQTPQTSTMYYRENGVLKEHVHTSEWEGSWDMIGYEYAQGEMVTEVGRIYKEWVDEQATPAIPALG